MSKPIILLLAAIISLQAEQAQLSDLEYSSLLRYDFRPNRPVGKYEKLRSYAKVSPSKAQEIARKSCSGGEEIDYTRLARERRLLFYRIFTKSYIVKVNALDGALIECKRRKL
ncbi:hypothetical protein NNO_0606 [Hydrogenimonas sp.]|nr:hypothetical protein NNO_0606 [Hydrogenimonas sp.]